MRSEWKTYTLNEVCSRIYSGGTPSTRHPEYWNGNLRWLSSGETSQRFIYDTERKITVEGVNNSSTRLAPKGCTVVATAGQGYTRGQASFLMIDTYMNQSVIACEANPDYILPMYLYYNLDGRYEEFRLLSDGTSTRGGLSGWILKRMEIQVPPLEEQERIVGLLEALDRKIELNNTINENLLQQALCLFEDEFVTKADIDEELPLYNFADYINGAAFKPDELGDAGLPVIKIAELKAGITGSTRFFSGDKGPKYLVHNKDILFSWSGNPETSIDLFIWSEGNGILNQHTFNVKSQYGCPWFTFLMLKYHKPTFTHIASNKQTTGLGHVTAADLKRLTFPFDLDRMNAFETTVRPIMDLLYGNLLENRELSSLRDTLLPRLMSGELDVSDIDL